MYWYYKHFKEKKKKAGVRGEEEYTNKPIHERNGLRNKQLLQLLQHLSYWLPKPCKAGLEMLFLLTQPTERSVFLF